MSLNSIKAFSEPGYNYYRLKNDFGFLKAGAIFYHDTDDQENGSIAEGCLKLCWKPDGGCYSQLCGGTIILHADFAEEDDLFERVCKEDDSGSGI